MLEIRKEHINKIFRAATIMQNCISVSWHKVIFLHTTFWKKYVFMLYCKLDSCSYSSPELCELPS